MSEELKPCPFCGGNKIRIGIERLVSSYDESYESCWIDCEDCSLTFAPYEDRFSAIAAWNRRATNEPEVNP